MTLTAAVLRRGRDDGPSGWVGMPDSRDRAVRAKNEAVKDVVGDAGRAFLGLIISIILAYAMPILGTGKLPSF